MGTDGPHDSDPRSAPVLEALAQRGWGVFPGFVPPSETAALAAECRELWQNGCFRHAGIGRGESLHFKPEVRNDKVLWLDAEQTTPAQARWLGALDELRRAINEKLYLGLFEFEGHFAVYPPGSFYRKHSDQFRGIGLRTVTTILYLNENWQPEEGGQLRIYLDGDSAEPHVDVLPEAGTLVCFLSADYLHEVLPATRERMSVTGWFRRRE